MEKVLGMSSRSAELMRQLIGYRGTGLQNTRRFACTAPSTLTSPAALVLAANKSFHHLQHASLFTHGYPVVRCQNPIRTSHPSKIDTLPLRLTLHPLRLTLYPLVDRD